MTDFQNASLRALIVCAFTVPTLLYGMIVISNLFDLTVPIWLVWAVTTVPPAVAALVVLVRVVLATARTRPCHAPMAHGR